MSTNPMADEGYAIGLLRRAMTSGVDVDHEAIAEETGCPVDIVRSLHERLTSGRLPTAPPVGYRAPGRVVPPQHADPAIVHRVAAAQKQQQHRTPAPPATHPVSDRWRQAAGHALPDLARAHDAAARLIREIEAALDVAAAHERAAAEKARRDEQLADAKERLRDARATANECRPAGTSRLVDGRAHPCARPGCNRVFDTAQGLALHRTRVHGGAA